MNSRLAGATLAVILMACALSGCAPEPEPAEPAPLFTSEAEAFAAAEETYRAYVDALNQVDLSDPATFEDVFAWTTGEASGEARSTFSQMHGDGWTVRGKSRATVVEPRKTEDGNLEEVQLAICLDVSSVELLDSDGTSVVDVSRPDVQSMLITLAASNTTPTRWAIADFQGREGEPTCG